MEQRNLAYDLIRALAIIFIVIIHSSEPLSLAEGFFPRLEYAILRIVCNEAKPTFYLMIVTGILWILHKAFPAFEVGRQMFAPFIPWIFCFLSGYALTRFLQDNIRVRRIIQWTSLGIFLLNIVLRMTLNLSVWIEIFTAVGLFSLLLEKAPSKLSPVSRALSKYSYGIYLSHFLLISAFIRLVGDRLPISIHPFIVAAVVLVVIVPLFWVADKLHLRKIVS